VDPSGDASGGGGGGGDGRFGREEELDGSVVAYGRGPPPSAQCSVEEVVGLTK